MKKQKVILPEAFSEYKDVFDKKPSERLFLRKKWDHVIDLKPDFIAKDCHNYPTNPAKQEKLKEFLDKNLRKGYIRPSISPQASPFFFVAKKESNKL